MPYLRARTLYLYIQKHRHVTLDSFLTNSTTPSSVVIHVCCVGAGPATQAIGKTTSEPGKRYCRYMYPLLADYSLADFVATPSF